MLFKGVRYGCWLSQLQTFGEKRSAGQGKKRNTQLSPDGFLQSSPQLAGQGGSSSLQIKTEELSRQYKEQLSALRQEKDQEIQRLRVRIHKNVS